MNDLLGTLACSCIVLRTSCRPCGSQSGKADVRVLPGYQLVTPEQVWGWILRLMEKADGSHGYREARLCGEQQVKRDRWGRRL